MAVYPAALTARGSFNPHASLSDSGGHHRNTRNVGEGAGEIRGGVAYEVRDEYQHCHACRWYPVFLSLRTPSHGSTLATGTLYFMCVPSTDFSAQQSDLCDPVRALLCCNILVLVDDLKVDEPSPAATRAHVDRSSSSATTPDFLSVSPNSVHRMYDALPLKVTSVLMSKSVCRPSLSHDFCLISVG